ncbi:MAG: hypothetical protein MMC23_005414 [Stictis urceolatum]|nr:hypothetical protein [Stictis urceolata]
MGVTPKHDLSSEDNAPLQTPPPAKRRRVAPPRAASRKSKQAPTDLTVDGDYVYSGAEKSKDKDIFQTPKSSSKTSTRTPRRPKKGEEKRLRLFRKQAPQSYLERYERATSQRMFVISRSRGPDADLPAETIELAGTTGNIYTVTISKTPSCTCPDAKKGNQCKHIIYALTLILKAPSHLQYQLAFLSTELQEIFSTAPPIPSADGDADPENPRNRKPVEGDCPICFTEFEEGEDVVWCKAACGNNIHQSCFEQWAKSRAGKEVRCVYCRTAWAGEDESVKRILGVKERGMRNGEGYVNVAGELGLSGSRDYSTYHQFWVRRQFRDYGHY